MSSFAPGRSQGRSASTEREVRDYPALQQAVAHPPAAAAAGSPSRPAADQFMRRLLRVTDAPRVAEESVHGLFSVSIVLSALRCLLSYIVLPLVVPLVGTAAGVGPIIGIPVAAVALVFDVRSTRRFWLADHRWRWYMTFLYVVVMAMVTGLLVGDVVRVV